MISDGEQPVHLCKVDVHYPEGNDTYLAELELLDGDTLVAEKREELEPGGAIMITGNDLPLSEGAFRARARVDNEAWKEVDLTAHPADPISAIGRIPPNGQLSWFVTQDDQTDCRYL